MKYREEMGERYTDMERIYGNARICTKATRRGEFKRTTVGAFQRKGCKNRGNGGLTSHWRLRTSKDMFSPGRQICAFRRWKYF